MKTDSEIRDDVIYELQWDSQLTDPDAIGVAVQDGAVTLTGHVPSYAEKLAAARAAERVSTASRPWPTTWRSGCPATRGTTQTSPRRSPTSWKTTSRSPRAGVHARVQNGWVTLDGEVDYDYQRREVERMVRHVRGVIGVTDTITVRPPANPERVREVIEDAFKREAEVDARHISVEVADHTVRLYGHVHSLAEASAARAAAASAPGIAAVESHLVVSP